MQVVLRGVGLGDVFVSCAAYALRASRGNSDSHAREPMQVTHVATCKAAILE